MAYELNDFRTDVIERSYQRPVLVDFWAEWCGPCRTLGPTLESLAEENTDNWDLVKIDSDAHQDLSRQFGVRSIPSVKLFVDGEVADEFVGALPRHHIEQWLERAIPSDSEKSVSAAKALLVAGDRAGALEALESIATSQPDNAEARFLLASELWQTDLARSIELVTSATPGNPADAQLRDALLHMKEITEMSVDELPEGPGRIRFGEAMTSLRSGDTELAMEAFLDVIRTDRYYRDDASRKVMIGLFTLLGSGHELTRKFRRSFDMALY